MPTPMGTPTVTVTPTPTPTPDPTPTADPTPTPTPNSPPEEGAYQLAPAVTTATFDRMLGVTPIPGSPDEAVVITQIGFL